MEADAIVNFLVIQIWPTRTTSWLRKRETGSLREFMYSNGIGKEAVYADYLTQRFLYRS